MKTTVADCRTPNRIFCVQKWRSLSVCDERTAPLVSYFLLMFYWYLTFPSKITCRFLNDFYHFNTEAIWFLYVFIRKVSFSRRCRWWVHSFECETMRPVLSFSPPLCWCHKSENARIDCARRMSTIESASVFLYLSGFSLSIGSM